MNDCSARVPFQPRPRPVASVHVALLMPVLRLRAVIDAENDAEVRLLMESEPAASARVSVLVDEALAGAGRAASATRLATASVVQRARVFKVGDLQREQRFRPASVAQRSSPSDCPPVTGMVVPCNGYGRDTGRFSARRQFGTRRYTRTCRTVGLAMHC